MKTILAFVLMLGIAAAYAADEKPEAKKSSKPKPAAKSEKSDKNVFQKTESSVGKWAHENKIWMHGSSKK